MQSSESINTQSLLVKLGEFLSKDNIAMLFLLIAFSLESECKITKKNPYGKIFLCQLVRKVYLCSRKICDVWLRKMIKGNGGQSTPRGTTARTDGTTTAAPSTTSPWWWRGVILCLGCRRATVPRRHSSSRTIHGF